ncbi:hypothetical protein KAR91_06685 [Candidatus Pacearchaeota archaeon]|nr:hypothetical protein [Candidatus Pacearchaeota archaeon]
MMGTIPTEEKTGMNCLFVRIDGDKFIFMASGPYVIKKDVIVGQLAKKDPSEKREEIPETFMIPVGDVKAFLEVIKSHKSICKKLQEEDEDRNFVGINNKQLSSFGSHYDFEQPKFQFKELGHFFEHNQEATTNSFVKSGEIKSLMAGFSDSKEIETFYCAAGSGEDEEKFIHYKQKATGLEAVFICPSEEIEEEGDVGEQTSF